MYASLEVCKYAGMQEYTNQAECCQLSHDMARYCYVMQSFSHLLAIDAKHQQDIAKLGQTYQICGQIRQYGPKKEDVIDVQPLAGIMPNVY